MERLGDGGGLHARRGWPRMALTVAVLAASTAATLGMGAVSLATSARAVAPGSPRTITSSGRIGSLQLGRSSQAAVKAALGLPAGEAKSPSAAPDAPAIKALGYECSQRPTAGLQPIGKDGPPYCATIYYLDTATGVLGGFWTISTRYATSHGTRVGTPTQVAESQEHHLALGGCLSGISENSRSTLLFISIRGGRLKLSKGPDKALHVIGGSVSGFTIESRRNPVGVLFC